MQNFGTIIDNFDAVTKQYVDDKASAKRIRSIKVENADVADTANKVKNAFTYKAHDKAAGTVLPITYDGRHAASLDFSANDFTYDYNSFNDIKIKLAEDVKTSLRKADTALQNVPSYNDLPNIPVINQDLSATDFTPVANTYYKHTGTTTASYTNGVIYYYNGTGYAALDGSGSGGGKKYQLVKKTMRCTVSYDPKMDILSITSPSSANKNMLDVLKENNNCSLRLYRGLDTMTEFYVDLQPHQYREDKTPNPTEGSNATKIHYDFTGGLKPGSKDFNMFSASFDISPSEPNILKMSDATKSMAMVNFVSAPPKVTLAFKNYTDGKCAIADLIWWELEEVTE